MCARVCEQQKQARDQAAGKPNKPRRIELMVALSVETRARFDAGAPVARQDRPRALPPPLRRSSRIARELADRDAA
jgi:hypothetical protein